MKNLKIGLMLFLVVLASGSTMAKGTLKVEMVPGDDEKAMVNVLLAPDSKFEVSVIDSSGKVIYNVSDKTQSFDYRKIYDFSSLGNGKYTFEVKMGDETEIDDLLVKDGEVQIAGQEELLSPYFKLNGKFLEFTFPNTTEKEARLLLYNNDKDYWIFQETLRPEYDISQELNLAALKPGSYKAVLISGENSYDYRFHLN